MTQTQSEFKSKSEWRCPYCFKTGQARWNKECYYALIEHLQLEHLEESFKAVVERLDKKAMLESNAGWATFAAQVGYIGE